MAVLAAFVIVLLAYPKQTLLTIGALVGAIVLAIVVGISYENDKTRTNAELRTKRAQSVSVSVVYSPATCGQVNPLSVTVNNGGTTTLNAVSIYLQAYRPGYSTDLIHDSYESIKWDRILLPGQHATLCYQLPQAIARLSYPPDTLEIRVSEKQPTFQ